MAEMVQVLFPLFDRVVVTPVDSPRSASVEDLLAAASSTGANAEVATDASEALMQASNATPMNGLVVVAGSVFLVGKIRGLLTGGSI